VANATERVRRFAHRVPRCRACRLPSADGRRLTAGPGNNEGSSWAPNGRHLVFQSSRSGGYQLFTMLADGSEQQPIARMPGESTSAAWSPRLP